MSRFAFRHRLSRHGRRLGLVAALVAGLLAGPGLPAAAPVDDARLRAADDAAADWLSYGHGYHNTRHSPLAQIDRENVRRLAPAWMYQTGLVETFSTSPLVADGRMVFSTPHNHVVALDAATGQELWRYRHRMKVARACCGVQNRGVALGYGRVYMITADARLLALDAETGDVAWDVPVADPESADLDAVRAELGPQDAARGDIQRWSGFSGNMAPLVFDGLVLVGVTGAGYTVYLDDEATGDIAMVGYTGGRGRRAFMSAYAADTGRLVWRWYTTGEHWEGGFTRETGFGERLPRDVTAERAALAEHPEAWLHGGGSLYAAAALDPELGLVYFGTGNPSPPLDGATRPGDNLYTASVVALDARTGEPVWHHQQVPHDLWGYEAANPPVLFELPGPDGGIPAAAVAGKAGWLYVYDRRDGTVLGRSEPLVPQRNLFRRPTREGIVIAPGHAGGANWSPGGYHPATGWVYMTAMHRPARYVVEDLPDGEGPPGATRTIATFVEPETHHGRLSAVDPITGEIRWQVRTDQPLSGGLATTAGGLLFMGEGDGRFTARDVATGELLWEFRAGAGVNAPPVVYAVHGRQYVAVAAGGHKLYRFPMGNALIAFALPPPPRSR